MNREIGRENEIPDYKAELGVQVNNNKER